MIFDARRGPRCVAWLLLLSYSQLSCADDVTEIDCYRVEEKAIKFAEQSIFPLADDRIPPRVDRQMVSRLKEIRDDVGTCALRDVADNGASASEVDFLQLDRKLSFFEVTLEQTLDDNPAIAAEMTRILVGSTHFREAVKDLQATLGAETRQQRQQEKM